MADVPVDDLAVFMSSADAVTYEAAALAAVEDGTSATVDASWLALADGHWGTVKVPPA